MKKIILISLGLMMLSSLVFAQKYACVDTEYILGKIPNYKSAQEQMEKISAQYQKEVEDGYRNVDEMYKSYQAEKALLTDAMKKKREDEIIAKEKTVKALQQKYFAPDGELAKKREELMKPIQERIFNAIKNFADDGGYATIFDLTNNSSMIYVNSRYDVSDKILEKLGYKQ
ncbi:MAG: OmpH family outer membrane protein [Prevotellaceae bacterium]|jgi:outer membrane protein|nr:OmpH family outer membrane protein [Prevotellaceae bacterium]